MPQPVDGTTRRSDRNGCAPLGRGMRFASSLGMKPHILVPYDFSPASAKALSWAADLQRSLGGLTVHVIHVVDPMPATAPEMLLATLSERDLKAIADALTRAVRERGVTATTEVILAPASGHVIVDVAQQRNADLIAMGTHGRGGLSRLVLGSVAEFVVRHAPCPVVTLRAEAADAAQPARYRFFEEKGGSP